MGEVSLSGVVTGHFLFFAGRSAFLRHSTMNMQPGEAFSRSRTGVGSG